MLNEKGEAVSKGKDLFAVGHFLIRNVLGSQISFEVLVRSFAFEAFGNGLEELLFVFARYAEGLPQAAQVTAFDVIMPMLTLGGIKMVNPQAILFKTGINQVGMGSVWLECMQDNIIAI